MNPRRTYIAILGQIGTLGVFISLWYLASSLLNSNVLPDPISVFHTLFQELTNGLLVNHIMISSYRVIISIVISAFIGTSVGIAIGMNQRAYSISAPVIYLTYPIPKIVFLPLVLLFLGLGDASKIFLISLILFFQVVLLVRDNVRGVSPELILSVKSLGAGTLTMITRVYFPAALPGLFSALRISTGVAIAVLFFVESFGTHEGLGYYILIESWGRLAYEELYAGVLSMAALGLTIYYLLDASERYFCKWNQR
jgi:NitT/TauT family transport system permease protein